MEDEELNQLEKAYEAMKILSHDAQQRCLQWLEERFESDRDKARAPKAEGEVK